MMRRHAQLALLGATLLLTGQNLHAAPGIVNLRDGTTSQGDVTETPASATVLIHGVQVVIPRADIASIEYSGDYDADFHARVAKLDPKDVPGRIAMAREAFDKQRYDLSRDTLEEALRIDPNSRDATDLLTMVQGQMRLARSPSSAPAVAPTTTVATAPRPMISGQPSIERRLLTPADVEAIRRAELRLSDANVRIRFDGDVKKRFADSQNLGFADFTAQPTVQQAITILDHGDDAMRTQVHVLSDPASMLEYRRQIQPLIVQNCATSNCHGGSAGGALVLYTSGENDLITYTNFYILQNYSRKLDTTGGGVFGNGLRRLIDRTHGQDSLLANYGLPATMSTYDHPPVNGNKAIQPIFRNQQDQRYQVVVNWMNEVLAPIQPDYGIHYTPPTASATSMPATAP